MSSLIDLQGPVAFLKGINLNATGDNAITLNNGSGTYALRRFVVTNASADLSGGSLQYGIFSAVSGGGEAILASGVNSATSLTAASKFIAPAVAQNDTISASTVYFRVGVANGAAATADVYLFGDRLP
jgi:hypothetical protein